MTVESPHPEQHRSHRSGWLRAAVLGANDGVVSVAALVIGVAAASTSRNAVITAGIAALIAGAMSMATGEYVSVSTQRDAEEADLRIERDALEAEPELELRELAGIYERRGLDASLAVEVAKQLHAHDALSAHKRDELGLTDVHAARPFQAAWTSALAFTVGAIPALVAGAATPTSARIPVTAAISLAMLAALGAIGAKAGGAPLLRGAARVVAWSSLAMALTYGIGRLVGANIG